MKAFNVVMPIAAVVWFVVGLINVFKPSPYLWIGITFIGLGLVIVAIFLAVRKFLRKKNQRVAIERKR